MRYCEVLLCIEPAVSMTVPGMVYGGWFPSGSSPSAENTGQASSSITLSLIRAARFLTPSR